MLTLNGEGMALILLYETSIIQCICTLFASGTFISCHTVGCVLYWLCISLWEYKPCRHTSDSLSNCFPVCFIRCKIIEVY